MAVKSEKIKLGTRGSPLALFQTRTVQAELAKRFPALETEIVVIKTSGDWSPADGEVRLLDAGGRKGQFSKEIEAALLEGRVDAAVHSMKDMETDLPEGLVLPFMLPREDVRDAFLSNKAQKLDDLPDGCVVGTASVRRAAFLLSKRPGLKVVPFRGNVQTRIDKMRTGQVDATFLACAGLNRLGLAHEISSVLAPEEMMPASGQGAVGIEVRAGDERVSSYISQISDFDTVICVTAERAVLATLDGSCHTPVGAYARLEGGEMWLRAQVVSPDGRQSFYEEGRRAVGDVAEAALFGDEIGCKLKQVVPQDILSFFIQK
ncbi:MAG: hydroxymethylbilane synthase [Alphaproteobacteria bacterium]|nr:hydroxymethylbilane synthase [Alphaproteobacteria bacterium]